MNKGERIATNVARTVKEILGFINVTDELINKICFKNQVCPFHIRKFEGVLTEGQKRKRTENRSRRALI